MSATRAALHADAEPRTSLLVQVIKLGAISLFFAGCFFPFVVNNILSAPYPTFIGLWVYGMTELLRRRADGVRLALWVVVPLLAVFATYYFFTLPTVSFAELGDAPAIVRDYVLLLPVAVGAGIIVARDPDVRAVLIALRLFAAAAAAIAVVEGVTNRQLFGANQITNGFGSQNATVNALINESGALRSIGAADHPLVLATILACVVPIVLRGKLSVARVSETALLLGGILATNSTGPLLLAVAAVACRLARPVLAPLVRRASFSWVRASYWAGVAAFLVLAIAVWTPVVDNTTGADASSQYRFALFSLIPRIIAVHPFGYGLGNLAPGELLVEQQGRPLDASVTVDSELVLLVIQAGVIGLALYLLVLWLAVRGILRPGTTAIGTAPLLVLTLGGIVLALHVWNSIGPLWEFFIGVGIAAWLSSRRAPDIAVPKEVRA